MFVTYADASRDEEEKIKPELRDEPPQLKRQIVQNGINVILSSIFEQSEHSNL